MSVWSCSEQGERGRWSVELETKVCEVFIIPEEADTKIIMDRRVVNIEP